jgi:hypothetical protein
MKNFSLAAVAACLCFAPLATHADEASHLKAAESLFAKMNMEAMMSRSTDQMLQMQVQQNPSIAPFIDEMTAFMRKYMGWSSLKDDMAKIYTQEFTEEELTQLGAFYETSLGKKSLEKLPQLMAKGAGLGQQRVQEHMPELKAAIDAKAAKMAPPAK